MQERRWLQQTADGRQSWEPQCVQEEEGLSPPTGRRAPKRGGKVLNLF